MPKKLLSVGVEIPGGGVEQVELDSKRSLLDADIVIFCPGIPSLYSGENYNGKTCLTDDSSFRSREAMAHWRGELKAAFDAGKLVLILMSSPHVVYAATGEKRHSGTGRNTVTTRIVTEMSSYDSIPLDWKFRSAFGKEMVVG